MCIAPIHSVQGEKADTFTMHFLVVSLEWSLVDKLTTGARINVWNAKRHKLTSR